jgi:selenocysteine lyase/cysteine desulfurase
MDAAALRREFPVLERLSYLNAGTNGPVPSVGARAAEERLHEELEGGRAGLPHFESLTRLGDELRTRLSRLLGCEAAALGLTHSTTEGVNVVLSSLDLRDGDELLTTDEEHPGVLAPLATTARRTGASIRTVPFDAIAGEARPSTKLVACSHVSWVSGRVVDAEALAAGPTPVLLDGAQGLGAVPTDVHELGCDFYAASGQKWLCGPSGTGCLFVRGDRVSEIVPAFAGYESLADPQRPEELALHADARRLDRGPGVAPLWAWWLASLELLTAAGWTEVHRRGAELAARLAGELRRRGLEVAPRGPSTLVAWRNEDAAGTVERLAASRVVVRDLPGRGLVRASVGAWTSEEELERLVALVG